MMVVLSGPQDLAKLKVHSVDGLCIAHASIPPRVTTGNTIDASIFS
jgi:hypothetical protein